MGNPSLLKFTYDFSIKLIRDFLDPVPLKLDQLFSENSIRDFLKNLWIPGSLKNIIPVPLKIPQLFFDKLYKGFPWESSNNLHITFFWKAYKGFLLSLLFHNGIPFYPFHKIRVFIITLMLYFSLIILYWDLSYYLSS